MATIRKLASGRINVQIRQKDIGTRSKTFDTMQKAKNWIARQEKKAEVRAAKGWVDPKMTFEHLAGRYCIANLTNPNTRRIMEGRIVHIAKALPADIRKITKHDVNKHRLTRLEQVSPTTVREELQIIHRIFRWTHRELILDREEYPSPVSDVAMPPPSRPRNRVIQKHELELLMTKLSPIMKAIVELAFETAMRRGEIVALRAKHVELDERILSVIDGKTGDRSVPLTRRAVELLRNAIESCPTPDARLFPVTPHSVSTAVRRARKEVGLDDDVRLHQLRHTRVTNVAKKGMNQAQIMLVSGHRDVRSVQKYTHLNVKDVLHLID